MMKFFRRKNDDGTTPKDPQDASNPSQKVDCPPTETPTTENAVSGSWFSRVKNALSRTRSSLTEGLMDLFLGKKAIDDTLLESIETHLLTADVGVDATDRILKALTQRISRKELDNTQAVYLALQQELTQILLPCEAPLNMNTQKTPFVILMIGVNGAGKTTTMGKLTKKFQQAGKTVMLAAGDTFRAAAIEQLKVWGERNDVPVIAQHNGADSASVIFDAFQSAKAKGVDVLIADTAGRLHTRENLMEELKKVKRVIQKLDGDAPHEVMLILDASNGQNSLLQAQKFNEAIGVTGITLTKLDGTAKGGIIFAIANSLKLPIRFIGVGERIDDIRQFEAQTFVDALFDAPHTDTTTTSE